LKDTVKLGKSSVSVGGTKIPGVVLAALMSGLPNAQLMLCFLLDQEHRWDGFSLPEAKRRLNSEELVSNHV
jgi:hypothetical protein